MVVISQTITNTKRLREYFLFLCFVISKCPDVHSQMKNSKNNENQAIQYLLPS